MKIEVFDNFYDALHYLDYNSEWGQYEYYFKAEIFKTEDGRWRVGIITERQMEMDV